MAKTLPDRDLAGLIGTVIINGSRDCIRANSYEVRLGDAVRFESTGEEFSVHPGQYIEIEPGDLVTIASLEKLDFTKKTLSALGHNALYAQITPTTTMMREAIIGVSTKVDPGFRGVLNWGIRNSSIKRVKLCHGERLFKLTLFELMPDEVPDKSYGESASDSYQDTEGIRASTRTIPVDIKESSIVRRSLRKADPQKQLIEAGYPFSYIGTELVAINGRFEIVSKDVATLRRDFSDGQKVLEQKIVEETSSLSRTIEQQSAVLKDRLDASINGKLFTFGGSLLGSALLLGGIYKLLSQGVPASRLPWVFLLFGVGAIVFTALLPRIVERKR